MIMFSPKSCMIFGAKEIIAKKTHKWKDKESKDEKRRKDEKTINKNVTWILLPRISLQKSKRQKDKTKRSPESSDSCCQVSHCSELSAAKPPRRCLLDQTCKLQYNDRWIGPETINIGLNLLLFSGSQISFLLLDLGRYLNIWFECVLISSWYSITYLLKQPIHFQRTFFLTFPDSWYFGWSISQWCPPTVFSSAPPLPQDLPSVERFAALFSEEMDTHCLASLMNIAWHHDKYCLASLMNIAWHLTILVWQRSEVKQDSKFGKLLMWTLCPRAIRT